MILNAYAILNVFLALVPLLFGLLVIGLGVRAWLIGSKPLAPESRKSLEDRGSLLFLMAFLLLGLDLVSWPLLYLLEEPQDPDRRNSHHRLQASYYRLHPGPVCGGQR